MSGSDCPPGDRPVGRHRVNGRLIFQSAKNGQLYYLDKPPVRYVGLSAVVFGDCLFADADATVSGDPPPCRPKAKKKK